MGMMGSMGMMKIINPIPSINPINRLLPPRGDYQTLFSFKKAKVVYDNTFRDTNKFPARHRGQTRNFACRAYLSCRCGTSFK